MAQSENVAFFLAAKAGGSETRAKQLLEALRVHLGASGLLLGEHDAWRGAGFFTEASLHEVELIFVIAPTTRRGEFVLQISPARTGGLLVSLFRKPRTSVGLALRAAGAITDRWLSEVGASEIRRVRSGNPLTQTASPAP
jgi:hypothetical protein